MTLIMITPEYLRELNKEYEVNLKKEQLEWLEKEGYKALEEAARKGNHFYNIPYYKYAAEALIAAGYSVEESLLKFEYIVSWSI